MKKLFRSKRRLLSLGSLILFTISTLLGLWMIMQQPKTEETSQVLMNKVYIEPVDEKISNDTYFGLDDDGNLSLFEGLPSEKKVVRSFFQLDIEYLESSLPQEIIDQLHEGIQITDYAQYNSVLSTFSEYAIDITDSI